MNLTEIVNDLESQGSSANIALKLFNYPEGTIKGVVGDCELCPIAKYIKKGLHLKNRVGVGSELILIDGLINLHRQSVSIQMGAILKQFVIDFDAGLFPELTE